MMQKQEFQCLNIAPTIPNLLLWLILLLSLRAKEGRRPSRVVRDFFNQPEGMLKKSISRRRVRANVHARTTSRGLNTSRVGESILAMDG